MLVRMIFLTYMQKFSFITFFPIFFLMLLD